MKSIIILVSTSLLSSSTPSIFLRSVIICLHAMGYCDYFAERVEAYLVVRLNSPALGHLQIYADHLQETLELIF